ncbi:MAG: hypothetical protein K6F10_03605 [Paludibacteraceae bacterium]|nr:hypothetical protein [Paludibacteraceae bacterium]
MENQNNTQQQEYIDIAAIFKTLWQKRKVFYWVWPITFVVSAALILCVPRYYTCKVVLAPEAQSANAGGSLSALASSFGFDMRSMNSSDALYPMIYPEIVSSPNFLVKLFDVPVKTSDGKIECTYYQYLQDYLKAAFWTRWKRNIIKWITPKTPELTIGDKSNNGINVFCFNKMQWNAIQYMQKNITCKIDKKTDVITISVTAQDRLVCALIADSVCATLKTFITDYRTQKARTDIQYYEEVMEKAYNEYQQASNKYTRYVDSHSSMNMEQYRVAAKNLETEMRIKESAYTSFQKQYLATQARIQENTPVYTVLQSASIPPKAAGPRRVLFVLTMLILATCVTCFILCKEQLLDFSSFKS